MAICVVKVAISHWPDGVCLSESFANHMHEEGHVLSPRGAFWHLLVPLAPPTRGSVGAFELKKIDRVPIYVFVM